MALTGKQRAFIDEYLKDFNATRAAKAAGYSENTARSIGHENLTKPDIAVEIARRMAELTMSTDEALIRLSEQGRGAHAEFIDTNGSVDIGGLKAAGLAHLIKGTKETKFGVVVEFYDAQAAIDKILRVSGSYVDRKEISGPNGGPIQTEETDNLTDDQRRAKFTALRDIAAYLAATGESDSGAGTGDDTAE